MSVKDCSFPYFLHLAYNVHKIEQKRFTNSSSLDIGIIIQISMKNHL